MQIGAIDIRFVGDQHGPPDFEATYMYESIAVEVTRTKEPISWPRELECAFAKQLRQYIEEITDGTVNCPRWYASCEYDPRETRPPGRRISIGEAKFERRCNREASAVSFSYSHKTRSMGVE